jgi:glucose-6-phosphate 1-dehydrogenase
MASTFVIFGASGDLTSRKLVPALYQLHRRGRLPKDTRIVGFSRRSYSNEQWREELTGTTRKFSEGDFDDESWKQFAANIFYHSGDIENADDFPKLNKVLTDLEGPSANRVYYLSTMPSLYPVACTHLGKAGMANEATGTRRIVIEKPFGTDLATAKSLNKLVHEHFQEQQVYRIDHYLGKETVQNMLVLRFANTIFEPIWNRNYIDHVQITVAEDVDVGRRGDYYDKAGVMRDMFQNHLLQLMMIVAMEAPVRYEADLVRDEKVKVLRAVRPMQGADFARNTLRAQYDGYLQAPGVPTDSQTATFAVIKMYVDNWRWNNVPFYLRSGKAMSCRTTQIVIQFREPPHMMFADGKRKHLDRNKLILQIQPAEGIQLQFQTKVPDAGMRLQLTDLDFSFRQNYKGNLPEAYQRLLLDALNGDASLFARHDEVELSWGIIDPVLAAWTGPAASALETYEPGGWGPESSTTWMSEQGRDWFDVCPVLS